ncbi:sperm acrosome membrane-associated protein 4 [Callorhinchus milii]|uniref:Prostate stem cell antigen-like protein n=1 Tax=Callorhinchus milii TaxID=7868 RepID=V9LJ00_CALMI|nr:sperm acrosome membrane-associated protein 4 [Callorhinchus milii]|eukprot:gi/632987324/ref/XP_007910729.1/ PREDICTED: sperm acrosome membrane-associated protein 4-like [Callorhinchus milii]
MRFQLVLGSLLLLFVAYGAGLTCFNCIISTSKCISGAKNCTGGKVCYERVGKIKSYAVYTSGCIERSSCNKNFQESLFGVTVSLNTTCCERDLCNGGSGIRMPLLTSVALAIGWLAYLV